MWGNERQIWKILVTETEKTVNDCHYIPGTYLPCLILQQPCEVDNIVVTVQIRKGEAMVFANMSKPAGSRAGIWRPRPTINTEASLSPELVCVRACVCMYMCVCVCVFKGMEFYVVRYMHLLSCCVIWAKESKSRSVAMPPSVKQVKRNRNHWAWGITTQLRECQVAILSWRQKQVTLSCKVWKVQATP